MKALHIAESETHFPARDAMQSYFRVSGLGLVQTLSKQTCDHAQVGHTRPNISVPVWALKTTKLSCPLQSYASNMVLSCAATRFPIPACLPSQLTPRALICCGGLGGHEAFGSFGLWVCNSEGVGGVSSRMHPWLRLLGQGFRGFGRGYTLSPKAPKPEPQTRKKVAGFPVWFSKKHERLRLQRFILQSP